MESIGFKSLAVFSQSIDNLAIPLFIHPNPVVFTCYAMPPACLLVPGAYRRLNNFLPAVRESGRPVPHNTIGMNSSQLERHRQTSAIPGCKRKTVLIIHGHAERMLNASRAYAHCGYINRTCFN
jgi:hypothetical protein